MMAAKLSEKEMKDLTPSELLLLYILQTREISNVTDTNKLPVAYTDFGYYDTSYYNTSYYDANGYNDDNGRPDE